MLAGDNSVITHHNAAFLPKEEGNTILTGEVSIVLSEQGVFTFKDDDNENKYAAISDIEITG